MTNLLEQLSDWLKHSVNSEGLVLTDEMNDLVGWLARAQRRPVEAVVNDLLSAELEQKRRNQASLPRWRKLTRREREAAVLVLQGYTNSQIARTMGITPDTVRSHIQHICSKYEARGKNNLRARLTSELQVHSAEKSPTERRE